MNEVVDPIVVVIQRCIIPVGGVTLASVVTAAKKSNWSLFALVVTDGTVSVLLPELY